MLYLTEDYPGILDVKVPPHSRFRQKINNNVVHDVLSLDRFPCGCCWIMDTETKEKIEKNLPFSLSLFYIDYGTRQSITCEYKDRYHNMDVTLEPMTLLARLFRDTSRCMMKHHGIDKASYSTNLEVYPSKERITPVYREFSLTR